VKNKNSQNIKKTDDPLNDEFEQIFDDLIISKVNNRISEMENKILDKLTEVNKTNTEEIKKNVNSIISYMPKVAEQIATKLAENEDFIEELSNTLEEVINPTLQQIQNTKSKKEIPLYKIISLVVNFSLLGIGIFLIFLHFFH